MTTYADFVSNLCDLVIPGVKRRYEYPPASVSTADMPLSFPLIPSGEEFPITLQAHGGWPTFRVQFVVILEAVAQNSQSANFGEAVEMMDSVAGTLRDAIGTVAKGPLTWTMRVGEATLGGTAYWAVITDVQGHG